MRLEIATDNPGVMLPKVVVSILPAYPDNNHVTIDLEILSVTSDSITLEVDDDKAAFQCMNNGTPLVSPYENPGDALPVYLGAEYGRVGDHIHRDRTGDDDHFVIHADSDLLTVGARPGCAMRRLTLRPLVSGHQPNKVEDRQVALAEGENTVTVTGRYTLGGWVRIVRKWPANYRGGLLNRIEAQVRLTRLGCGGLYLWLFAPQHYQFDHVELEVGQDGKDPEERRVNRESVQDPPFKEFPLWKGLIVGKEGVRNQKRVTCNKSARIELRTKVTSHALRFRARKTAFLIGVGVALSASTIVQTVWGLMNPAHIALMWVVLLASGVALVWLVRLGIREPLND